MSCNSAPVRSKTSDHSDSADARRAQGKEETEHEGNEVMPISEDEQEGAEGPEDAPEDDAEAGHDGGEVDPNGEDVEAEMQRPLTDPGMPSRAEVDEHNLTHIKFRPWCAACVKAQAKNQASITVNGDFAQNLVP